MKQILIRTLIAKGKAHELRCEDDYYVFENEKYILSAVFDGCSSGIDSHFASTMFKKIISIVAPNKLNDINTKSTANLISEIVVDFRIKLEEIIKILNINTINEMLSTLCLCLFDKEKYICSVIICGDGVCTIDGKEYNKHDKNGNSVYYITNVNGENTEQLKENTFIYLLSDSLYLLNIPVKSTVAISSDGIDSFVTSRGVKDLGEIKNIFFNSEHFVNNNNMLKRIYNIVLNRDDKLINIDDLSMVRIILKSDDEQDVKSLENKETYSINNLNKKI